MDDIITFARSILSISCNRWNGIAEHIPVELLKRRPLSDEWSAIECLHHLIDGEAGVYPVRLRALLAGENIADYDEIKASENWLDEPPKQLATRFTQLRTANLGVLYTISTADLSRSGIHSALGRVALGDVVHYWVAHDLMHLVQAERAIMQPFILGSGPWRPYYADHDVEPGKR